MDPQSYNTFRTMFQRGEITGEITQFGADEVKGDTNFGHAQTLTPEQYLGLVTDPLQEVAALLSSRFGLGLVDIDEEMAIRNLVEGSTPEAIVNDIETKQDLDRNDQGPYGLGLQGWI
jgi:hypothetical protein